MIENLETVKTRISHYFITEFDMGSGKKKVAPENDLDIDIERNDSNVTPITSGIIYDVTDSPPFGVAFISALQIIFHSIGSAVSTAFLVHVAVCAEGQSTVLVSLISTSLFLVGLTTFLQVTFGLRLPVTQGSSQTFLIPILIMANTDRWRCPSISSLENGYTLAQENVTDRAMSNSTDHPYMVEIEPWASRIAEISGCLAVASCLQIALGMTGVIGVIVTFVGPLTTTPLLALLAVYLAKIVVYTSRAQWGISLLLVFLTIIFTISFASVQVPCPSWNRKKGFHLQKIQVFRVFATTFAIAICWLLCLILTVTDFFPNDPSSSSYKARTDAKLGALEDAPWIFIPYPGKWGPLTSSAATTVGMLAAVMASVIESLGDYKVTSQVCQVPPPPRHAINRAVLTEGVGCLLSGLFGACHATTSYSNVIGYVNYTGMAARVSWQIAGVLFMMAAVFGKFGGLMAMVPEPIIGGLLVVSCGMVFASAVAAMEAVNMQLPRNLMTLGAAIMIGAAIPVYIESSPEALQFDKTGVLEVILTNGPLIGAMIGFTLDNLLPGSQEDRGIRTIECESENGCPTRLGLQVYEFNYDFCKTIEWPHILKYVPFSPIYRENEGVCSKFLEGIRKLLLRKQTRREAVNSEEQKK